MHGSVRVAAYDGVAKLLHWLVVILLSAQFVIAWTMPPIHRGTVPQGLIDLHLTVGVIIIVVVLGRLVWRIGHPVPLAEDGAPPWQHRIAELTHHALYALLLIVPLLGWANASARGWTVTLFWLVSLPKILPQDAPYGPFIGDAHSYL